MRPGGRPRIDPVDDPTPEVAAMLATGWQYRGAPLNVPATLAHHPKLLKRFSVFAGLFLMRSALPDRDRELLTLRSTFLSGTEYYFGHHVRVAGEAGLSDNDLRCITDLGHRWTGRDAVLIAVADELVTDGVVTDETWAALAEIYDSAQALEAVFLPGFYRMVAGVVNSIGVQPEPGLPGFPKPS